MKVYGKFSTSTKKTMGILSSLFGNNEQAKRNSHVQWIPLTSMAQIDTIKAESKSENVVIFKHSTRCGISSMVIKRFEALFDADMGEVKVYYLDLLSYRSISDEIGYTFQVMHQSPQVLIIKNENAILHASHYDILELNIKELT